MFSPYFVLSLVFVTVVVAISVTCEGTEVPDMEYALDVLYGRLLGVHIPLRTVALLVSLIRSVTRKPSQHPTRSTRIQVCIQLAAFDFKLSSHYSYDFYILHFLSNTNVGCGITCWCWWRWTAVGGDWFVGRLTRHNFICRRCTAGMARFSEHWSRIWEQQTGMVWMSCGFSTDFPWRHISFIYRTHKNIKKAVHVTGRGGPCSWEVSSHPYFVDSRLANGRVVRLKHRLRFTPPPPPRKIPCTHFV
jgi:hypothetical protein